MVKYNYTQGMGTQLTYKPKISVYSSGLNSSLSYNFDSNSTNAIKLKSTSTASVKILSRRPSKSLFGSLSFSALILLALSGTSANAFLSATTANTIQGTGPYIESNGIKATNLSSLLSIKVGTDAYVSDAAGNMRKVAEGGTLTPVTAITLANEGAPFDSVGMLVPPDGYPKVLDEFILSKDRKNDDGGEGPFTITGDVTGEWKDKRGNRVTSLTDPATICDSPYTLTLTSANLPSISMPYGDPRQTHYLNGKAVFTINPVGEPKICYAKPNMSYSAGLYAGPSTTWNASMGFIPQSTTPETYDRNFPTTGSDGFYFDLYIGGVPSALTWRPVTVGNVTATMTHPTNSQVRVTLTGPKASNFASGATAETFTGGSADFVLEGRDAANTTIVKYGFRLKKWFVASGNVRFDAAPLDNSPYATWCKELGDGYYLPHIKDLTNTPRDSNAAFSNVVSAVPHSIDSKYFMRNIGGGFLAEWGDLSNYSASSFPIINGSRWRTRDISVVSNAYGLLPYQVTDLGRVNVDDFLTWPALCVGYSTVDE